MKKLPHLAIQTGPAKGQKITVSESGFRIGRHESNDLAIEDETLSREHCRFFFRSGALWVSDLKSANGTSVNDQPVESVSLEVGDHVSLGGTRIKILNNGQQAAAGFTYGKQSASPGDAATGAPGSSIGAQLLQNLCWVALIAWWAFLAYGLCLPPPASLQPAPTQIAEPPPEEEPPSESASHTPAQSGAAPVMDVAVSEAERAAGDAESLLSIKSAIARRLLLEDYAGALTMVQGHIAAGHSPDTQATLESFARYISDIQALNGQIATALGAQAGRRITLRAGGTNVPFRVVAVAGSKLRGAAISATGEKEMSVEISRLHPADRLHWLGDAQTPEANALRAVLEQKGGNRKDALTHAQEAGMLADALQAALADR